MWHLLFQIGLICFLLLGCEEKTPTCPPAEPASKSAPPTETAKPKINLTAVAFESLPGWRQDDLASARRAFALNCEALAKTPADQTGTAPLVLDLKALRRICQNFQKQPPADFRAFLQKNFQPYAVTADQDDQGRFTSYYESKLKASRRRHGPYQYPVYGKPEDLIELDPHDFDASLPSRRLVGRVENNRLRPYYTRSEILEDKDYAAKAPVILWADSYVDVYVMQIQGSAVADLDDGSRVRIGFAGTNGRPFRGIGSILLEQKLLKPGEASMGSIKRWLKKNFARAYPHMNQNQRYVFHRLIEDDGPIGALGVPLTPGRSLAVDRAYIPLGALLWLDTADGSGDKIQKLVLAQDIGGAIKGPVRGDYFWGSGGDEILEHAGKMNSSGRYFILFPRAGSETKDE